MTYRISKNIISYALALVLSISFSVFAWHPAKASTLVVNNLNDNGAGSLREAISLAASGDTINIIPTGTLTLTTGQLFVNKSLTINGSGRTNLTIGSNRRIFEVTAGVSVSVYQMLLDGAATDPDPHGPRGGAIYNSGTLILENITLSGNAVYTTPDYFTTPSGGAIYNIGHLTLRNVSLDNNRASSVNCPRGGAIYNESGGVLDVSDTTFNNNWSHGLVGNHAFPCAYAGALFNAGTASIQRSIFYANSSIWTGGIHTSGTLVLTNSTLNLNTQSDSSPQGGSALSISGTATLSHVTISQNNYTGTSSVAVPGVYIMAGTLNLRNSIIAGNTTGSTISSDVRGTITSQGYNLVQTRTGSSGYISSDLPDGTNPLLNAIADNGGSTLTASIADGSPAIDAIPTTGGCNDAGVTTDQRGAIRPFGAACDIGAYEAGAIIPPTHTPTITPTQMPTLTPTLTSTPTQVPSATPTSTNSPTPLPNRSDTIGIYKDASWYLRNTNSSGSQDIFAVFGGEVSDLPVVGDWNGDGIDGLGIFRSNVGQFILSDANTGILVENYRFTFGNPGDTPFAGKWTPDMAGDGIGVYRNSNGILYQRKSLTSGVDDFFAIFGNPDDRAVAGDWDGNGFDSVGIYRASNQTWFLTNNSTPSGITFSDINFMWDIGTNAPVVGDWDGMDGGTVGYLTITGVFDLRSTNANVGTDMIFAFGPAGGKPVAGKWIALLSPSVSGTIGRSGITGSNPDTNASAD